MLKTGTSGQQSARSNGLTFVSPISNQPERTAIFSRRAIFLDRDGVLNRKPEERDYVTRWAEMDFSPEVPMAIALLRRAGFSVIIVSTQRCVAKGLESAGDLEFIHETMRATLEDGGAYIDAVYYQPECGCRKPQPGMLLEVARAHDLNLAASWMIGDSDCDVEAGKKAGCRTARLVSSPEVPYCNADVMALSLLDAAHQILRREEQTAVQLASVA
jgi:D-glycero-D-manno-heptose 1,7-bisphosphate phosphatase